MGIFSVKWLSAQAAVIMLAFMAVGCSSSSSKAGQRTAAEDSVATEVGQVADSGNAADSVDMEAAKAFVERFYKEGYTVDLPDNDYLKQHVTQGMLKFLADSYDYDCEGECLAAWMFFYEDGGDVGGLESLNITARDGNHILVENKYENYEYDVLLTVIKDGEEFKIDSLQQVRSEYIKMN